MKLRDAYVTAPVRTPIGSFGGQLLEHSAPSLGKIAAQAAIERSGLRAETVDQVIFGHGRQAGCGPNPARQVGHGAGVPQTSEAYTVNQACNSGLKSIMLASQQIALGQANVVLAGGMESMSNTPHLIPQLRFGIKFGDRPILDGMYKDGFMCPLCDELMGETAENLAEKYGIDRDEQDQFAARSQNLCEEARKKNLFDDEIVPVEVRKAVVTKDEHPRDGVTAQSLAKLKPVFRKEGTVHAGNACGVTDGAASVLVVSEQQLQDIADEAQKRTARVVDFVTTGVDPRFMGIGPVPAVKKLLERTNVKLSDIDLIEINEAFAAQVIACDRELKFDMSKVNVNGGSIALGHPIGATGTRIVVTLLHEMARRQARYGLATLCVSGGLGGALLLESVG